MKGRLHVLVLFLLVFISIGSIATTRPYIRYKLILLAETILDSNHQKLFNDQFIPQVHQKSPTYLDTDFLEVKLDKRESKPIQDHNKNTYFEDLDHSEDEFLDIMEHIS